MAPAAAPTRTISVSTASAGRPAATTSSVKDNNSVMWPSVINKQALDHQLSPVFLFLPTGAHLDLCGVCGGDNSTCVILNGGYNSSQYGYNVVTRIPAGSSSLDIRQRGYQGSNRDDNYLALMDPQTGEYLLNGNFVVSMFQKTIQFGGTTIEYTGSDAVVERLNSSKPLKRDVVVQVFGRSVNFE